MNIFEDEYECRVCGMPILPEEGCPDCDQEERTKKPVEFVRFDSKKRKPKYINNSKNLRRNKTNE